jgi:hypothetical protein
MEQILVKIHITSHQSALAASKVTFQQHNGILLVSLLFPLDWTGVACKAWLALLPVNDVRRVNVMAVSLHCGIWTRCM